MKSNSTVIALLALRGGAWRRRRNFYGQRDGRIKHSVVPSQSIRFKFIPSPMEAARLFAKRTLHHDQFTNVLGGEQSDELTGVIYDRQGRRIRFPDHHKRTIKTHLRN